MPENTGPNTPPHANAHAASLTDMYAAARESARRAAATPAPHALVTSGGNVVVPATHDSRGRVGEPGNKQGRGRPKGAVGVAREVAALTNGGKELIQYFVNVWRNKVPMLDTKGDPLYDEHGEVLLVQGSYSDKERKEAAEWLADRLWGKAAAVVDLKAVFGGADDDENDLERITKAIDSGLADEDLDAFEDLARRVLNKPARRIASLPEPEPIEAEIVADTIGAPHGQVAESQPSDVRMLEDQASDTTEVDEIESHTTFRPTRTHVFASSTNVDRLEYDANAGVLVVAFKGNRGTYRYRNITTQLVDEFVNAPSAGKWIAARLKPRADLFPCVKVS